MEGPSSVLSRSSKDIPSYLELDNDDDDLFDESVSVDHATFSSAALETENNWDTSCLSLEMEAALRAAMSSRTLTPLLKEELRCKIQLKRLQHGKEEITPDFSVKPFAMSLEEVAKKNKKMEQNRMSAQRSRERQKSLEKNIQSRLEQLQRENTLLADEARSLRHACHMAREWLRQHRECLEHTWSPTLTASSTSTGWVMDSKEESGP